MSVSIAVKAMTREEMVAAAKARWNRMGMVRPEPVVVIKPPMPAIEQVRKPIPVKPPKVRATNETTPDMYFVHIPVQRSTMEEIVRIVCEDFEIEKNEMMAYRRHKKQCTARQVAMYLAKKATHQSYPAIAKYFNRDHTTVLHAVDMTEIRILTDIDFYNRVSAMRARLAYVSTTHLYWGA